jgi:NADPH:quinone reductase-like Zn-dependent oxidoreductase
MAGLDRFDVIFDAVGKSSFVNCRPLLAPGGTYVTTLPTPSLFFWSGRTVDCRNFRERETRKGIMVRPSGKDLAYLCQLADEGKLRPTVSLTLSLDRAAGA